LKTECRVLGAVEIWVDGHRIDIGHARQRSVLAILLVAANQQVSIHELIARVWGERAPRAARNVVHGYIARLRRALSLHGADVEIVTRQSGYVAEVAASAVDLHRFRDLIARAHKTTDDDTAAGLYSEALRLWNGRPFADVPGLWLEQLTARLDNERLAAATDWADTELRRGGHIQLLPHLQDLAATYPLDERIAAQLILALYRSGHKAKAVGHYHRIMRRLTDELGVDPGPSLQRLHQQILRDSSDLQTTVFPKPHQGPLPAQLPHDVRGFTGRDSDLAALHKLVSAANDAAVTTCVISGPAGVGKTALAVHFGHQVAGRFPDGQIYIDLYGFHPHRPALERDEALGQLLRALGVDPQRIPTDIDAQTALYRSLTASRRLLIVLDNAATADQVRSLLPGSAACLVLITSRNRMPGLVVRDEAYSISLAVLNSDDAHALLAGAVGRDRIDAEPDAADKLAGLCGYLPLALRVAAARLSMYRHYTLADLADQLAVERDRLDLLAVDDDETGAIRSAFSWSYSALDPEAARVFRLLGLHAGPDFSVAAVAALTATTCEEAHTVLGLLISRNLLDQTARDRYRLHDLMRLYAAELASADKFNRDGAEAVARLMQWYLHTADAAGSVLLPNMRRVPIDPPEDMCRPLEFETPKEALAWCETEITNLVAITEHAVEIQEDVVAWKIPMVLWAFFTIRKRWNQWVTTTQIGLTAARRSKDQRGEAHMLTSLAYAYHDLQRFDDAIDLYKRALAAWAAIDDSWGRAATLTLFGNAHHDLQRFDAAIDSFKRARELFMEVNDRWGHGWTLHNLARSYLGLRRFDEAVDHCQLSLRLFREINDRWGQSWTLYQLGTGCWRLRRVDEAIRYYHEAITICQQIGNRQAQGFALTSLANACRHSRRLEEAFDHSRRALSLFREIGDGRGEAAARIVLEKCLRDSRIDSSAVK